MDPNFCRPPCLFMIIFIIIVSILSQVPMFLGQDNEQYAACGNLFQCTNIPSIGYPFSGENRPAFCGHPGFQLNCQGSAPIIKILSMDYRVLAIDDRTRTFTVAREDMWNNTCPSPNTLYNTTIDFTLFSYAINQQNVTLNYGCNGLNPGSPAPNQFDCQDNSRYGPSTGYFTIGNASSNVNESLPACIRSVFVPVNQSSAQALASNSTSVNDLRAAIDGGFQLQWATNYTMCNQCIDSGGRCGSNSTSPSFACYCADRSYGLTCMSRSSFLRWFSKLCPPLLERVELEL